MALNPQDVAAANLPATATPLELSGNNKPITWVGTGTLGSSTQITISPALYNYAADANVAPTFSSAVNPQQFNLLVAAARVWQLVANVQFNFIPDVPPGSNQQPIDIRVGLSQLSRSLGHPSMGFVGNTEIRWDDSNNHFLTDNVVAIEDPAEHPVTPLSDGDFQYDNTTATMFQAMIHELGHAIGLDHNPNDPTSIMNPTIGSKNRLPDSQDIAAAQSLYGAPTQPLQLSQMEQTTLQSLLKGVA